MRTCNTCGKQMTEGYVWGDGEGYACSDSCLFVDGYTADMFDEDYDRDAIYYTEWEPENE